MSATVLRIVDFPTLRADADKRVQRCHKLALAYCRERRPRLTRTIEERFTKSGFSREAIAWFEDLCSAPNDSTLLDEDDAALMAYMALSEEPDFLRYLKESEAKLYIQA